MAQPMQRTRHAGGSESFRKHRPQSCLADRIPLLIEEERRWWPIIRPLAKQCPDLRRAHFVDIALRAIDQADRWVDRASLVALGDSQGHADQRMILVIKMCCLRDLEDS